MNIEDELNGAIERLDLHNALATAFAEAVVTNPAWQAHLDLAQEASLEAIRQILELLPDDA